LKSGDVDSLLPPREQDLYFSDHFLVHFSPFSGVTGPVWTIVLDYAGHSEIQAKNGVWTALRAAHTPFFALFFYHA